MGEYHRSWNAARELMPRRWPHRLLAFADSPAGFALLLAVFLVVVVVVLAGAVE